MWVRRVSVARIAYSFLEIFDLRAQISAESYDLKTSEVKVKSAKKCHTQTPNPLSFVQMDSVSRPRSHSFVICISFFATLFLSSILLAPMLTSFSFFSCKHWWGTRPFEYFRLFSYNDRRGKSAFEYFRLLSSIRFVSHLVSLRFRNGSLSELTVNYSFPP